MVGEGTVVCGVVLGVLCLGRRVTFATCIFFIAFEYAAVFVVLVVVGATEVVVVVGRRVVVKSVEGLWAEFASHRLKELGEEAALVVIIETVVADILVFTCLRVVVKGVDQCLQ